MAAVLLLTLRGTPTIYYGEELGLRDVAIPADRALDVRETNQPGRGLGRDPVRTPMPWTGEPGGGFTTGRPWLPVGDENLSRSVVTQRDDPGSMLSLYRRLIELRRREPALAVGSYRPVPAEGSVLAYRRRHADRELLVALNLCGRPAELRLPPDFSAGRVLIAASGRDLGPVQDTLALDGDEALVMEPQPQR